MDQQKFIAWKAWQNCLDESVKTRSRTANTTLRQKPKKLQNTNLLNYSKDRALELEKLVREGSVHPEASLAFNMYFSQSSTSFFFLDAAKRKPVVVMMTNGRQELNECFSECDDRLGLQMIGSGQELIKNFDEHGLQDALIIMPSIDKDMNNAYFFSHRSNYADRKRKMRELESYAESLSLKKRVDEVVEEDLSEPAMERTELSRTHSMTHRDIMDLSEKEDRGGDSPLANVMSRFNAKMTTITFGGTCTFVSTISPEKPRSKCGSDDEKKEWCNVDISTEGVVHKSVSVPMYPFVHYDFDTWRALDSDASCKSYWKIHKSGFTPLYQCVRVKTLKQIREEDRRHLERMKNHRAWMQKMVCLGSS